MKKLLITAACLIGGCGLVLAQGAGVEPPKAADKRPAVQSGMQTMPVAMKKKKKPAAPKSTTVGKETGTAKDPAGPAGMRDKK